MSKTQAGAPSLSSVVSRNDTIVFTDLDDTIVMMDVDEGQYYELDPVAAQIWSLIEKEQTAENICVALAEGFDVDATTCKQDTLEFLQAANEQGIIHVRPEGASS